MTGSATDRANQRAWGDRDVVEEMVARAGFSDDGEAHAMRRAAAAVRDEPVLDLGVGGGRTTSFLRAVSNDYVGIDYVPELARAAARRFPDARIEHMDARDLGAFGDGAFALVVFSCNGIDGATHADRGRILHEVARVLRPRGLFCYSTRNLDWTPAGGVPVQRRDWRRIIRRPRRSLRQAVRRPLVLDHYRRLRKLDARGEDWATMATLGYGFAVTWHHVTFVEAWRELRDAGFATVELYRAGGRVSQLETSGEPPHPAAHPDLGQMRNLHLVARRA